MRRAESYIKAFMVGFRKAFPDLNFWGTADLIAEGDYVVGRLSGRVITAGDWTEDAFHRDDRASESKTERSQGDQSRRRRDGSATAWPYPCGVPPANETAGSLGTKKSMRSLEWN
jgi:hypothetical protein